MRSIVPVLGVLLAGCTQQPSSSAAPAVPTINDAAASASREPVASSAAPTTDVEPKTFHEGLPGDACTPDGYWSFFEAFVRIPRLRAAHSDAVGRAALGSFDIAQQDSRWVRAADPTIDLALRETRNASGFEVAATPVELDSDDEIVRAVGETRRYRFALKDGCWQFGGIK